jgi:hypothetical protein
LYAEKLFTGFALATDVIEQFEKNNKTRDCNKRINNFVDSKITGDSIDKINKIEVEECNQSPVNGADGG